MALSRYLQSLIGTPVANRIAYLVSRSKQIGTIIKSVREISSRTQTSTIEALTDYYREAAKAARRFLKLALNKPIESLNIPSESDSPTFVRAKYNVDVTFGDGTQRTFYNLFADCDLDLTGKELLE